MKRWRFLLLPIVSALYWGACIRIDSPRIAHLPGWELDVRAAICGMCIVISMLLVPSVMKGFFEKDGADE